MSESVWERVHVCVCVCVWMCVCVGRVRSQMGLVNGAVMPWYCRVLSCTLHPHRLVGLTQCCDYFLADRRIAAAKMTVQGTGVVHLINPNVMLCLSMVPGTHVTGAIK